MLGDPRNIELLRLLADNPRVGVSELARHVGLSAPATRERLARLEEAKVIAGYRLLIDPAALGYPIAALIRIRPSPGQLKKVIELAEATPQVVECHRVTGEDCFVLKVYLPALAELDSLLDRFLVFGQTTTSLIQSTPVPPRDLPLPIETEQSRDVARRGAAHGHEGRSQRTSVSFPRKREARLS